MTTGLEALDKRRKHTVEVVVDRFLVREEVAMRLAESFETASETALKVGQGMLIVGMDRRKERRPLVFSESMACR